MISISRLLALFCAIALAIGAAPARSAVFTEFAPLVSPPITVTSGNPLPVTFDFGQSFASINDVHVILTFSGDLWDTNELWLMDGIGGQENLGGLSAAGATLHVSPGNVALYTDLLDGTFSTNVTAADWFTTTSFGLQSVALQIDATPLASVPEPAALALFAAGLIGLTGLRRRRA